MEMTMKRQDVVAVRHMASLQRSVFEWMEMVDVRMEVSIPRYVSLMAASLHRASLPTLELDVGREPWKIQVLGVCLIGCCRPSIPISF
jgi:hypothetical protein